MSGERTEKATPERVRKARESGDWVRSRELLAGFGMLAGMLALGASHGALTTAWRETFLRSMPAVSLGAMEEWDATHMLRAVMALLLPAAAPMMMLLGAVFTAAGAAGLAQSGGIHLNMAAMTPKASRLNPVTHVKQLVSVTAVAKLAKSLVPAALVVWLSWKLIGPYIVNGPALGSGKIPGVLGAAYSVGTKAAMLMVAWSGLDYAVERRAWSRRLRMTKQEIREEVKQAMGNPHVKGKIRQVQRARGRAKRKPDLSKASVVITNPTHFAVALEFSFETMQAPIVLAKGRDRVALQMREDARWAGVPIIENPPLARSLYRAVEPGEPIPFELYAAIAGILAFLYKQTTDDAGRRAEPQAAPTTMQSFQGGM